MWRYGNKKRWMNEDNASQRDCKHRGEIRGLAGVSPLRKANGQEFYCKIGSLTSE